MKVTDGGRPLGINNLELYKLRVMVEKALREKKTTENQESIENVVRYGIESGVTYEETRAANTQEENIAIHTLNEQTQSNE